MSDKCKFRTQVEMGEPSKLTSANLLLYEIFCDKETLGDKIGRYARSLKFPRERIHIPVSWVPACSETCREKEDRLEAAFSEIAFHPKAFIEELQRDDENQRIKKRLGLGHGDVSMKSAVDDTPRTSTPSEPVDDEGIQGIQVYVEPGVPQPGNSSPRVQDQAESFAAKNRKMWEHWHAIVAESKKRGMEKRPKELEEKEAKAEQKKKPWWPKSFFSEFELLYPDGHEAWVKKTIEYHKDNPIPYPHPMTKPIRQSNLHQGKGRGQIIREHLDFFQNRSSTSGE